MDRIDALKLFTAVAELESFTRAAERMGMTPGAASKQISALEERLQVRLLERTTRSVRLTDAGEALLDGGDAVDDVGEPALEPCGPQHRPCVLRRRHDRLWHTEAVEVLEPNERERMHLEDEVDANGETLLHIDVQVSPSGSMTVELFPKWVDHFLARCLTKEQGKSARSCAATCACACVHAHAHTHIHAQTVHVRAHVHIHVMSCSCSC